MAIKNITSGTGFSGIFADRAAEGTGGATGFNHKPVARWTEVPSEIFREAEFVVGLQAYHSEGIKEIEFVLNGGLTASVTEEFINPRTNIPEYCVKINRNNVIGTVGESLDNIELRAVITPNVGQVKILQHNNSVTTAKEGSQLVCGLYGLSGGYGTNFQNKRLHPGEHSWMCSLLKGNDDTSGTLPDVVKYMSPGGSDTNDGSQTNPVKTMAKCLEKVRDACATDTANLLTDGGSNYVDVSRGVITLLAGNYDPVSNYLFNEQLGDGTVDNRIPYCKNSYLRITGDPTKSPDEIVLEVPSDQSQPEVDGVVQSPETANNPHLLRIKRVNKRLGLIALQNMKFVRKNFEYGHTNFGFVYSNTTHFSDVTKQPLFEGYLWDNIIIDDKTFSKVYPEFHSNSAGTAILFRNSKIFGGSELTSIADWMRGNTVVKNQGDCIKQIGFAVNNKFSLVDGIEQVPRKIWFDPTDPEHGKYAKFNGLYTPIRYRDHLLKSTAFATDTGFTFDISKNALIGTIWQRLKSDSILDFKTALYEDRTDEDSINEWTYNTLGAEVGIPPNGWFGDDNVQELTNIHPARKIPFIARKHSTNPHLSRMEYYGDEGNKTQLVGESVYDDHFTPHYMALVTNTGPEGGTSGFLLFDSSKPLVRGSDSDSNTQEWLWRFSGSTQGIPNPSTQHNRQGGTGNFYHRGDAAQQYYYSWAETVTKEASPRDGNNLPGESDLGSTSDLYPVSSFANSGTDDSIHTDQFQWFMTKQQAKDFDGIVRIENVLMSYNEMIDIDGQTWNVASNTVRGNGFDSDEHWVDIAFVNNLMAASPFNYGNNSAAWKAPVRNMLLFNNTMTNCAFSFRIGGQILATEGFIHGTSASADNFGSFWSDYLQDTYGNAGVTLDFRSAHIVFRNNHIENATGDMFKHALGLTYDLSDPGGPTYKQWIPGGSTGTLIEPCIFENNYFWPFGTEPADNYAIMKDWDYFLDMPELQKPNFTNAPPEVGGSDSYDSTVIADYTPTSNSGLVGGASGSEKYDLHKKLRIERSTAGCLEPINLSNDDYIQTTVNTNASNLTLDPSGLLEGDIYGKRFRVEARLGAEDLLSTNTIRFENFSESSTAEDASLPTVYEFNKTSGQYRKSSYTVPDAADIDDPTSDWLPLDYNLNQIIIYGQGYGSASDASPTGDSRENLLKFFFDTAEQRAGFTAQYESVGISLGMILPKPDDINGIAVTLEKFETNGSTDLQTHIINNSTGLTMAIREFNLPDGDTIIIRPTGL